MLAVRNNIPSMRRRDIESDTVIVLCELCPSSKKKILIVVFLQATRFGPFLFKRPNYRSLRLAAAVKFDQVILTGDFNLPNIDWPRGTALTTDHIHCYFTKRIKDFVLWRLIDFPTRNGNILDLLLTTIPEKISNINGFDDILSTDHKLVSFNINFKIRKKPKIKRHVYNYKKADWNALIRSLALVPWDVCFVDGDVNLSITNWIDQMY